MGKVKELSSKDFNDFISKGNCVIDFWAEWCNPCKMMSPKFEEAAAELKTIKFAKVNIEDESELAQRFDVMSIPALLFFKNGEMIDQIIGLVSSSEITAKAEELFE